jgi:dTMP kinase
MEALALDFHHRVRAGYLTLVNEEPRRFRVVDAGRDTATVQNDIRGGVGAAIGIVGLS